MNNKKLIGIILIAVVTLIITRNTGDVKPDKNTGDVKPDENTGDVNPDEDTPITINNMYATHSQLMSTGIDSKLIEGFIFGKQEPSNRYQINFIPMFNVKNILSNISNDADLKLDGHFDIERRYISDLRDIGVELGDYVEDNNIISTEQLKNIDNLSSADENTLLPIVVNKLNLEKLYFELSLQYLYIMHIYENNNDINENIPEDTDFQFNIKEIENVYKMMKYFIEDELKASIGDVIQNFLR